MTCVIIDDEPLAIKVLEKYLGDMPDYRLLKTFTQPLDAATFLRKQSVDLLFLDINMPDLNGLSLLRTLDSPPLTILTTAYPEYGAESYEFDVVDYLLKPISLERFLKALGKAENRRTKAPSIGDPGTLTVKADRKIYRIPHEDIYYLQAYGDYVRIITAQQNYLPKTTLSELENRLPQPAFFRVHRTYLVNRQHVSYLEGNHLQVGEDQIPVSKAYRESVLQWIS